MVLSSDSSRTLEEVAQVSSGPLWFQQFLYKDRGFTLEMASRAEEAGYTAICITADAKVPPKRERNIRNNRVTPAPPNYYAHLDLGIAPAELIELRDLAATWSDLDWLAANTQLPLVVKGLMAGEDARQCAEHGAKAVIVSNHGGRQLDTTPATIEVLPDVVEAVDGRIEVYMDGGIRRGSDVFKALALGARALLIGRPIFWGLAVDGEAGVLAVLEMLRHELDVTMSMCGRPTIDRIDIGSLTMVSPLLARFPHPDEFREQR